MHVYFYNYICFLYMYKLKQGCTNSGRLVDKNFLRWRLVFVVLSMVHASYHPSSAYNFEVALICGKCVDPRAKANQKLQK
jgi:hypothetical protein